MSFIVEKTGLDGDDIDIHLTLTLEGVPEHISQQIKDEMLAEAKEMLARRANDVLNRHNIDMTVRQI